MSTAPLHPRAVAPPVPTRPNAGVARISIDGRPRARGGINRVLMTTEIRRLLRNRRTLVFTIVMPVAFYFLFGTNQAYANERAGSGNIAAFIMTSMALYGAMIATASAGASVSAERAQGWSRQLRLTPLRSTAYIGTKVVASMLLGAIPVVLVYICGLAGKAEMPATTAVLSAVIVWLGSMVFAAFGLFVGYLVPGENAMQLIGPGMALLAFGGGLFIPIPEHGWLHVFSSLTPMWGVAQLAHAPQAGGWTSSWEWALNIVVWVAIFVAGAAWRFRGDTSRG